MRKNKKILLSTLAVTSLTAFACLPVVSCVNVNGGSDNRGGSNRGNNEEASKVDNWKKSSQTVYDAIENLVNVDFSKLLSIKKEEKNFDSSTGEITTSYKTYWDKFVVYDATVVRVSDGDTYIVKYIKDGKEMQARIRSWALDTPEAPGPTTYVDGDPKHTEEQFASDQDTKFAESILTPGRKIKILVSSMSYDRLVGISLYSDKPNPTELSDFTKCYEFEVLKNGFSTPRVGESELLQFISQVSDDFLSFQTLFMPYFWAATNYGIIHKQGFYKLFSANKPYDFVPRVYVTHGDPTTQFMLLPEFTQGGWITTERDNNLSRFLSEREGGFEQFLVNSDGSLKSETKDNK
ncbi:hypothetical protein ACWXVL_01045 [Mycoplasma sp. 128]